jgi:hypothetical protein
MEWEEPLSHGGCPVEGYVAYAEDVLSPGFVQVYRGLTSSNVLQLSLTYPVIEPGKYYVIKVQAKNCGQYSSSTQVTVPSGSVP